MILEGKLPDLFMWCPPEIRFRPLFLSRDLIIMTFTSLTFSNMPSHVVSVDSRAVFENPCLHSRFRFSALSFKGSFIVSIG